MRPDEGGRLEVTTASAGWRFLEVFVLDLTPGSEQDFSHPGREIAIVPLAGLCEVLADGESFELSRDSVFADPPSLLYLPPDARVTLTSDDGGRVAIGTAPAEGRYSQRLYTAEEMRLELRGGGAALRQVTHVLAAPLPAERLIVYEILAPRGTWCGWPPHCHDGWEGSPYLEETYYFRFDPADGFAFHRNYRLDTDYDETFVAGDGDMVTVPRGFHTTTACAGANMYFLNFLAGEPTGEERAIPPCFDARYTWIADDWDEGRLSLPTRLS